MKNRRVLGSLSALSLIGFMAAFAMADEPAKPSDASEVGPLAKLGFLVGEWELDAEFAQADGSVRRSKATLSARWTMEGRALSTESRYPGGEGQPDFVGTAIYAFNPRLEKVFGSGINSLGNAKQYEVSFEDGKVIVVQTGMQFQGRPGLNRSTYYNIGANAFKLTYDYSPDDGQSWQLATFGYSAKRIGSK